MKILSGKLKGRNFFMPKSVRPTPNIVRKAVLDIMGQDLEGVSLIDIFSGSGAVGLEALSCGAKRVVFIEKDARAAEIISENIHTLNLGQELCAGRDYSIVNTDAFAAIKELHAREERFDIVFADPPYYRDLAKKTLKTISAYDIVHPTCYIILQHEKREVLPEKEGRFVRGKQRKYGTSFLTIYHASDT